MKRCGLVMFALLISLGMASAQFRVNPGRQQATNNGGILDKLYFAGGGGFGSGVSGGLRYTYYSLFPIIGYKITPIVTVGTGLQYQHYGYPDYHITLEQYGLTPFVRYNVNQVFFQGEYDYISTPTINYTTGQLESGRKFFSRLLFGIGYAQPVGSRSALNALVMYDVLYSVPSVFSSPIVVRVFFSF